MHERRPVSLARRLKRTCTTSGGSGRMSGVDVDRDDTPLETGERTVKISVSSSVFRRASLAPWLIYIAAVPCR